MENSEGKKMNKHTVILLDIIVILFFLLIDWKYIAVFWLGMTVEHIMRTYVKAEKFDHDE